MKATFEWIRQFVPGFQGDVDEMRRLFTASGTEVERVERVGDDHLLELAVTSNRVDCLGVVGLARDLAAVAGLALRVEAPAVAERLAPIADRSSVRIEDEQGCSRFVLHRIEGLKVGPSPDWLVRRLEAIGLRSVNNVVDATNYVMFETNQPFHAFDLQKVEEERIVVRQARSGESLVAINGKRFDLAPGRLVIADARKPLAIAGVMGGIDSEVGDSTTSILLEAACFDPRSIRTTSKVTGLSSDASYRFERGVDRAQTLAAARRCAALIVQLAGGELCRGFIDVGAAIPERRRVSFRSAAIRRIVGIDLDMKTCLDIFRRLELEVISSDSTCAELAIPGFRRDLEREIDLVEEVVRIHGLDSIPTATSMRVALVTDGREARIKRLVRQTLVGCGFQETLTPSFVEERSSAVSFFADTPAILIRNAMRQEESALRLSLLPSLLTVRRTNRNRFNTDVRIFECTVVYLAHREGEIPEHLPIVGGLLDGDYREARGVLERLAASLGIAGLEWSPPDARALRSLDSNGAAMLSLPGGRCVGFLGRPSRDLLNAFDIDVSPFYFELRLDQLTTAANLSPTYQALSKFPPVKRDLAVVVDEGTSFGAIVGAIGELRIESLEGIEFFDEYRGKQVDAGKKSLAFSLTYRSLDRTLTGEEVDGEQSRVIGILADRFGARLRE